MNESDRREFLKAASAGLAMAGLGWPVLAGQEDGPAGLPTRPLGKTGEKVSIIGLGGWHIGSIPESEAVPIIHEAVASGITFFDNAWDYHNGGSEEVMGKGLAGGYAPLGAVFAVELEIGDLTLPRTVVGPTRAGEQVLATIEIPTDAVALVGRILGPDGGPVASENVWLRCNLPRLTADS